MSSHARRISTPSSSRKRKDMETFTAVETPAPPPFLPASSAVADARAPDPRSAEPITSNLLLAGYMAHEYLTKGTLFGQRWDPGRAEAVPLSAAHSTESKKTRLSHIQCRGSETETEPSPKISTTMAKAKPHQSYAEVARLLKSDGVHIPGIVNPMQLARWIQM